MGLDLQDRLQAHLDAGDPAAALELLRSSSSNEVALGLARTPVELRARIFAGLAPEQAADIVEQISDIQGAELIEDLDPRTAAAILAELPRHDQADLLGEIDDEEAEAILAAMAPENAAAVRELVAYPDDVAGGLMITEVLSFDRTATVRDVTRDLQQHAEEYRDFQVQYIHVLNRRGELVGVVRLRDLLLSPESTPLHEVMIRSPVTVGHLDPLERLEEVFSRHDFLGLPVVDADNRLLGVLRRAACEEALAERSEDDFRKSQGIVGGEELRSFPYLLRARRRLSWLSINVVLNLIAASIIALYQETLAAVIALAVFLPIISDMSGCSGNQAVAVSMRELALGVLSPRDAFAVWRKEASLALLNGLVLGLVLGVVTYLWQQSFFLALVVAVALAVNTVVAVSIGGTVPLVLRALRLDPALASGPILTTVTDMCGFFLTLALATLWLDRLV